MAKTTNNYGLTKPDATDFYDINVLNNNFDKIDEELLKSKQVFFAECGVTTHEEIGKAIEDGKVVFCKQDSFILPLIWYDNDGAMFAITSGDYVLKVALMVLAAYGYEDRWTINEGHPSKWIYNYGTEDLTAGESTLNTGSLYFVYE